MHPAWREAARHHHLLKGVRYYHGIGNTRNGSTANGLIAVAAGELVHFSALAIPESGRFDQVIGIRQLGHRLQYGACSVKVAQVASRFVLTPDIADLAAMR